MSVAFSGVSWADMWVLHVMLRVESAVQGVLLYGV